MSWYLESGENSDVAINSKIEFTRNINGFKFDLSNKEDIERLENTIKDNLYKIGYGLKFLKLRDMDNITKMSLVEKGLITPKFLLNKNETGSILINDDENICIMINDKDHLKIQVFNPGLDLKNALNLAIELDQKIGDALEYSISKQYGYLTVVPTNVGTGLKASVKIHLPALTMTRNVRKVLEIVTRFGIDIKGMYGEEDDFYGRLYQVSNIQTLGITENEIVNNLNMVVDKIIKQERAARKMLLKNDLELEDRIFRSYGILTNCKKITSKEATKLYSDIKLGTDLGIIDGLTDLKVLKLYEYTAPASLQKYTGEQLDKINRDVKRAEVIKQIILADEK